MLARKLERVGRLFLELGKPWLEEQFGELDKFARGGINEMQFEILAKRAQDAKFFKATPKLLTALQGGEDKDGATDMRLEENESGADTVGQAVSADVVGAVASVTSVEGSNSVASREKTGTSLPNSSHRDEVQWTEEAIIEAGEPYHVSATDAVEAAAGVAPSLDRDADADADLLITDAWLDKEDAKALLKRMRDTIDVKEVISFWDKMPLLEERINDREAVSLDGLWKWLIAACPSSDREGTQLTVAETLLRVVRSWQLLR